MLRRIFKYYNILNTHSALVSGVGRSPIVVNVRVDQYNEPKYFLVNVAYSPGLYGYTQSPLNPSASDSR